MAKKYRRLFFLADASTIQRLERAKTRDPILRHRSDLLRKIVYEWLEREEAKHKEEKG